ncbi:hypothetical protein [Ferrimicrobium sp.]|uniref:hypothetical protein n=1 Tax=Ferrimicrobium sp. TaxID=2926050 RepID=UPI00261F1B21|nr:hypothetical protein [Ferrimicrobium sp.]
MTASAVLHGRYRLSSVPTEGLANLLKRVAFGFANFENYRILAFLYAGKSYRKVLDSIMVE